MMSDPQTFIESGMSFGPFPTDYCLRIESCKTYLKLKQGLKIAEFVVLRVDGHKPPVIWIVEAKSSSPCPANTPSFSNFIEEICCKLSNALQLWLALRLGRHPETFAELATPFRQVALDKINFRLILVIKGHRAAWLPPLQEALANALRPVIKTWALSPNAVVVMNDTMACRYGLIQSSTALFQKTKSPGEFTEARCRPGIPNP
jgi:hypothetical protein